MQQGSFDKGDDPAASEPRLSGAALLTAWERAATKPPLERALTLLRIGFPALADEDAAGLPLALRDHLLVALQVRSFGPTFSGTATCESCGERLEFMLPTQQVAVSLQAANSDDTLARDGVTLRLRLANTRDMMDAAAAPDLETACLLLLARCAEAVDSDGRIVALPETLRDVALDRLDTMHETAEIALTLACPACTARQAMYLDIASFLWAEVRHAVERLLDEVHELAWAYGWSEDEILAMSVARRQAYIGRVRG
jgi:hypothetical protein